jgi:hypothetical protein
MLAKNKVNVKGILHVKVFEGGNLVKQFTQNNLVVAGGRDAMAKLLAGEGVSPAKHITEFGAGTNGTAPAINDTALTGAFTKTVDATTYPSNGIAQFNFNIAESEANGTTIAEFGLFCSDGTLFNRVAVAPIAKTNLIRIEAQWQIVF